LQRYQRLEPQLLERHQLVEQPYLALAAPSWCRNSNGHLPEVAVRLCGTASLPSPRPHPASILVACPPRPFPISPFSTIRSSSTSSRSSAIARPAPAISSSW